MEAQRSRVIRGGADGDVGRFVGPIHREVLEGGCAVVLGPAGSDRTRLLAAVRAGIAAEQVPVRALVAHGTVEGIPFGALLPLLADAHPGGSAGPTRLAAAVLRTLVEEHVVAVVEDAQLLDRASIGVLIQALATGARVVLSVRDDVPPPSGVARLIEAARLVVRLVPLDERGTRRVLGEELGAGDVDRGLVAAVHTRTVGSALAVRAAARTGAENGTIRLREGRWVQHGPLRPSADLLPVIAARTDQVDDDGRRTADLVALAGGLGIDDLIRLGAVGGLRAAVEADLVRHVPGDRVVPADALVSDALVGCMTPSRRRGLLGALVSATDGGLGGVADALRRIELEVPPRTERLIALVPQAATVVEAERLARAAAESGEDGDAVTLLAEVLLAAGRPEEAIEELSAAEADSPRAQVLLATAQRGAGAGAERSRRTLAGLSDDAEGWAAGALRAGLALDDGRPDVAVTIATAVLASPDAAPAARDDAAMLRAEALAESGRLRELPSALVPSGARGPGWRTPDEVMAAGVADTIALRVELDIRRVRTSEEYLSEHGRAARAVRGAVGALLAAEPAAALELLRIAASLADAAPAAIRAARISALVLAGEPDAAAGELLTHPPQVPTRRDQVELERAKALLVASRGDLRGAASAIARVAGASTGVAAADCWYDAMRYGHPDAARWFLAVSAPLRSPGRAAQQAHARALRSRDPIALERASRDLRAAGLVWFAVDAAAAAVPESERRDPSDRCPRQRLVDLLGELPGFRSPCAVLGDERPLTSREADVVRLALDGSPARTIAARLGIGVRTVETHLDHAYRKLGVRSRSELRAALAFATAS